MVKWNENKADAMRNMLVVLAPLRHSNIISTLID